MITLKVKINDRGLIDNPEAIKRIKSLKKGSYLFDIIPESPTSILDNHAIYRRKVREVANYIGEKEPNVIHTRFKKECNLPSTSTLETPLDWMDFHRKFSDWVYKHLDIII